MSNKLMSAEQLGFKRDPKIVRLESLEKQIELQTEIIKDLMTRSNEKIIPEQLRRQLPQIIKLIDDTISSINEVVSEQEGELKNIDVMIKEKENEMRKPRELIKERFNKELKSLSDCDKFIKENKALILNDKEIGAAFNTIKGDLQWIELMPSILKEPIRMVIDDKRSYRKKLEQLRNNFSKTLSRLG